MPIGYIYKRLPTHNGCVVIPSILFPSTGISNVGPGECQVLKGAHEAAVVCRISHRGAGISRDFGTGINRGGAGFAVAHAMASQNI
jgi:hypothetical protein